MQITAEMLVEFLKDGMNIDQPVAPDTELFSTGLLDSVELVSLIAFVEQNAMINVRPAEVTLDNFDTVARIIDYVAARI